MLTGSTGFIGQALYQHLLQQGYNLATLNRQPEKMGSEGSDPILLHWRWDLCQPAEPQWFAGVDCVIHLAAAASVQGLNRKAIMQLNVAAPVQLFKQAIAAGCKRFIFLSSAQVNWIDAPPYNTDLYTQSKQLAEQQLRQLSQNSRTELVIIRPALVYGPGVKGNFAKLLNSVQNGRWLPLGALTDNRRSMLALANLLSFIQLCLTHPLAAQQSWNLADNETVSTAALIHAIGRSVEKKPKLLAIPLWCLRLIGRLTGRSAQVQRVVGSATINSETTCQQLGWQPPLTLQQQLDVMLRQHNKTGQFAENQPS